MSSIIRWRKGDTLRTVGIVYPKGVVWLLMASNDNSTADPKKSRNLVYPSNVLNNVAAIKLPRSGLVQCFLCRHRHKKHSVRGFLSTAAKKHGLNIESPRTMPASGSIRSE